MTGSPLSPRRMSFGKPSAVCCICRNVLASGGDVLLEDLLGSADGCSSSNRKLVVLSGSKLDGRSPALRLRSYEVTGMELRFGL